MLKGQDVIDRTNAVVKMANVTGEATKDVASYMTAIWNNFSNGADSLERFSDVLTALGASTASSTAEIAAGLEKFASIGDTIGLSYDYATSILASLVANTRQSAEVIGTALRSIFARIQGLSLGETLEDGVTLNKYSKALQKVGVEILDVSGNMKDANTILDETAQKWQTLTSAQQTALAQTVAGTRQYSQFVSIMKNWNDVETNLSTAANAEGTIDEQQEIYADSWEASSKRVQATLEDLYSTLIDKSFFTGLNDFLSGLVNTINGFVKGMGGVGGVLTTVAGVVIQKYAKELPDKLNTLRENFMVFIGQAEKASITLQKENQQKQNEFLQNNLYSDSAKAIVEQLKKQSEYEVKLMDNERNLAKSTVNVVRDRIEALKVLGEEYQKTIEKENKLNHNYNFESTYAFDLTSAGLFDLDAEIYRRATKNNNEQVILKKEGQSNKDYLNDISGGKANLLARLYETEQTGDFSHLYEDKSNEWFEKIYSQLVENGKYRGLDNNAILNNLVYDKFVEELPKSIVKSASLDTTKQLLQKQYDDNIKQKLSTQDNAKSLKIGLQNVQELFADDPKITNQLNDAITKLSSNKVTAEEIEKTLVDLYSTFDDTIQQLKISIDEAEKIVDSLDKRGFYDKEALSLNKSKEELTKIAKDTVVAQIEKKNIQNASDKIGQEIDDEIAGKNRGKASVKIEKYAQTAGDLMQIGSAIQGVVSGFDALGKAIDGEIDGWQGLGAVLGMATTAFMGIQAAINIATSALLPYVVPIMAVVAAITALVVIFKEIQKNSPEGKLKSLREESARLKVGLDAVKSSADNLQAAFNDYDSIADKIKTLTVGTEEWKDALSDAQIKALELTQQYKGLELDENGLLTKESQEKVKNDSKTGVSNATAAYYSKKQEAKEQEIVVENKKNFKFVSSSELKDIINSNFNLDSLDSDLQERLEYYKKNTEGLEKLKLAVEKNTIANQKQNETLAATFIRSDNELSNSMYADRLTKGLSVGLTKKIQQFDKQLDSGEKLYGYEEENHEKDFERYKEAAGIQGEFLSTEGWGDGKKFKYLDIDGQEQEAYVKDMRRTVASDMANEFVLNVGKNISSEVSKLKGTGNSADSIFADILLDRNIDNINQEQANQLNLNSIDDFGKYIGDRDSILSDEEKEQYGLTNEILNEILSSIHDFSDTLKKNLTLSDKYSNRTDDQNKLWELANSDNVNGSQAKAIVDAYTKISDTQGASAAKLFLNNVNTDNISEFSEVLNGIANKSVTEINDEFKKFGIGSLELAQNLYDMNHTITDSIAYFNNLKTVLNSINGNDTSITEEEFGKLDTNLQAFFQITADGTYKLTTSAIEFANAVKESQQLALNNDVKKLSSIQSYGSFEDFASNSNNSEKLEYIKSIVDRDKADKDTRDYIDALESDKTTQEQHNEVLSKYADSFSNISNEIQEKMTMIATTAENLDELKDLKSNGTINEEAYNIQAGILDAQEDLKGLDLSEIKSYAKEIKEVAKATDGWADSMDNITAQNVAKGILKMNKALDTLNESFVAGEDNANSWADIIANSTPTSQEYAEAMSGTKEAIAQLLDISAEYVSGDFIRTHLEEITDAATGSGEAIDNLKSLLLDNVFEQIVTENSLTNIETFRSELYSLVDQVNSMEIGEIGTDAFNNSLQSLIDNMGLTRDQIEALADAMNINVQWSQEDVPSKHYVPEYTTDEVIEEYTDEDGKTHRKITSVVTDVKPHEIPIEHSVMGVAASVGVTSKPAAPKISGTSVKANGSANNYSSKNAGGKSTKKSSGSGSKDKSKNLEKKENQKSELNVYHDVERAIGKVESALTKLDKKSSHYFGKELINSLVEQNRLLQEQAQNYEWLGRVINSELGRLQDNLDDYGLSFNKSTGEMLNYAETYNRALNAYNSAINAYNNSAQEESDKVALENAKDTYDRFKSMVDEYDKTLDKQRTNEQNILENKYKQIENTFKAWETNIKVTLDLSQAKQEWIKFWQKVNTDIKSSIKNYAKEIANSTTNFNLKNSDIGTNLQAIEEIKRDINLFKANKNNPNFTTNKFVSESEAANTLLEKSNELRGDAESLYDIYKESWDKYLEDIDNVVEKWDKVLDEFNKINSSLEHYSKVIELLYNDGDTAKRLNNQLYNGITANNLAQLNTLRIANKALEKERKELIAQGKDELDSDIVKITETIESNEEKLQSSIENFLTNITNKFKNSISLYVSEMDKALTNGLGLNKAKQQWQDAQSAAQGYYDKIERIYQLDTMENKWDKLINSTSNLKTQQKLKELQNEQLNKLKEKTRLSEYDIGLAERQLAIEQARVELENAQDNKNSMKLVRNEQGNWAYQYVADEDNVADKQQNLLDRTNEWYEYSKNAYEDGISKAFELQQQYEERITALYEEMNISDSERRQELIEEIEYINDYYYGEEGLITISAKETEDKKQELQNATFYNLGTLYEIDQNNYKNMTEEEQRLIHTLNDYGIDEFNRMKFAITGEGQGYDQILDKCEQVNTDSLNYWNSAYTQIISQWATNPMSIRAIVQTTYNKCIEAQLYFDKAINAGTQAAGVNFTNLSNSISKTTTRIAETVSKTRELTNETNNISNLSAVVAQMESAWANVATMISIASAELQGYMSVLQTGNKIGYSYTQYAPSGIGDRFSAKVANLTGSDSSDSSGNGGISNVTGLGGGRASNVNSSNRGGTTKPTNTNKDDFDKKFKAYMGISEYKDSMEKSIIYSDDRELASIYGFDTGGYTGEWNSSGKLAVLHEKELVLNKHDTKNILDTVSLVRSIGSINDIVGAMLNFGSRNLNGIINNNTNSNDNKSNVFNISAEFPNAENVNEIREAILSLPNLASQYLN